MHKRYFPVIFAVVMLAMVLPLFPTVIAMQNGETSSTDPFSEQQLDADIQTSSLIRSGYIGNTFASLPEIAPAQLSDTSRPDQITLRPVPIRAVFATATPGLQSGAVIATAAFDGAAKPVVRSAAATSSPPYEALEVARSAEVINLNPGQAITVWVDFKNVGAATWTNSGANFLALNVTDPAGRTSMFQHRFWPASYRPAKMLTSRVRPGETGRFRFALQAPHEAGAYTESFHLVAENLTWVAGGKTTFTIGVGQRVYPAPHWQAAESVQSAGLIKMAPGSAGTFSLSFTNTGTVPWLSTGRSYVALNVTNPAGRTSPFRHKFWRTWYQPARLQEAYVRPGETGTFRFALQAPSTEGVYTESFQLVAEGLTWVPGSLATMTIQVGNPQVTVPVNPLAGEPTVRIGLFTTGQTIEIAASGEYEIWDGTNTRLATVAGSSVSTVMDNQGTYTITNGQTWTVTSPPRFVPTVNTVIMQIPSFSNRPSWNTSLNDNLFRGTLEVRSVPSTSETWVVNELPLESYLRGMAESSNGSPTEYLKALAVAQRSYTLWHYLNGGKHKVHGFTLNATTDQVYRGYGFEARSIDPLAAVEATAGQVITHPSAVTSTNTQGVAFAPYFSGTDGRTRSYSEVWAGSYEWLTSVADPYGVISNALTLSGNHMVGMSAKGAIGFAQNGSNFEDILKYYYTGVSLIQAY